MTCSGVDAHAPRHFLDQLVGDGADFVLRVHQHRDHRRALAARRIALQQLLESGFQFWRKSHCWRVTGTGPVPQNEIHAADGGDHVGDQRALHHCRRGLQVAEAGRAHVHAVRLRRAVAHHVEPQLAARRFDHLVDFAFRHAEALGHDLEMVDEGLHLGLHLLAVGQHHVRVVGLPRARRHAFQACRTMRALCRISSTRTW